MYFGCTAVLVGKVVGKEALHAEDDEDEDERREMRFRSEGGGAALSLELEWLLLLLLLAKMQSSFVSSAALWTKV